MSDRHDAKWWRDRLTILQAKEFGLSGTEVLAMLADFEDAESPKALREAFVAGGSWARAKVEWDGGLEGDDLRAEAERRYPDRQPEAGERTQTDDMAHTHHADPPKEPRYVCRECHAINPGETFHWIDGKVYHPSRYDVLHGCGPVESEDRGGKP